MCGRNASLRGSYSTDRKNNPGHKKVNNARFQREISTRVLTGHNVLSTLFVVAHLKFQCSLIGNENMKTTGRDPCLLFVLIFPLFELGDRRAFSKFSFIWPFFTFYSRPAGPYTNVHFLFVAIEYSSQTAEE